MKKPMLVLKRNGEEVTFDRQKIFNAISAANKEVAPIHQLNKYQIEAVTKNVTEKIEEMSHIVSVEEIQDMVEVAIMEMRGYEVAQKYVRYRHKRELARKSNTTDEGILALINLSNEEIKQENSNKNPTVNSTQRDYMAGEVRKVSSTFTIQITLPRKCITAVWSISKTCLKMKPLSVEQRLRPQKAFIPAVMLQHRLLPKLQAINMEVKQ